MKAHLDLERTTYLVYGLLDADEKVQVAAHLTDCPACIEAVRRMQEERGLIVEATAPTPIREELVRSIAARVHDRASSIRRTFRRRAWGLSCAAAAFLAIGLVFLSRTRQLAEARSAVATGQVTVLRSGTWLAQADGYTPTPGDRIRTDDPAGVSIRLEEGSSFNIYRGSMVEFRGTRGPTPVLRLLEGQVHCQVVADPRPFTIEAIGTKVTVVGTEFDVHVLEDQPFFKPEERVPRPPKVGMIVHSGAVLFRSGNKDLRVSAGWVALSDTKGAPWVWGEIKDLAKDKALDKMLRKTREAKPAAETGTIETAWKERADRKVQERVDAVPWARLAAALVRHHRECDAAMMEQRSVHFNQDVKNDLERGWGLVRFLANELEVNGDFMQACRNKLAWGRFVEAVAEAMSGTPLTDDQLKRLQIPESKENLLPVFPESAPLLDRWKLRAERTLHFVKQLKEVLAEAEYLRVTRNVGPSFLIDDYRMWLIEESKVEDAADRLTRIWGENFQLPQWGLQPLAAIATRHIRNHLDAVAKFRQQRGETLTGIDELELSVKLLQLQVQAERTVSEIPSLNGEARARAAAGSDILFRIKLAQ